MSLIKKFFHKKIEAGSLDTIESAQYPLIIVPFYGSPVAVRVRELTEVQIKACGKFSLIETFKDKVRQKQMQDEDNMQAMLEYCEKHHEICKSALVKPTFEEIIEKITDQSVIEKREKLKSLEEKLKEVPIGKDRTALEKEIDMLMAWTDFLLPSDFTAAIVSYVLHIDRSGIKDLTEELLLEAAVLAELGHDNPADHLHGEWTDFLRDDINYRAWLLRAEQKEEQRRERKNAG